MTPERDSEFNELLGYVGFFATAVWQIDPASEVHPANAIERIVQQFGKSKALVGLRQAANDTIEETSHWNSNARAIVDEACRVAGVVTLSEITRRYSASYKRIVKRGFINVKRSMMKLDFTSLDSVIIETLSNRPFRLDELSGVPAVRNQALRLNIRRAGVSPSDSADTTINERLQALRRNGRVTYDSATSRWCTI
jgi:hypothetical protein